MEYFVYSYSRLSLGLEDIKDRLFACCPVVGVDSTP